MFPNWFNTDVKFMTVEKPDERIDGITEFSYCIAQKN
jgi:hypothetical protein